MFVGFRAHSSFDLIYTLPWCILPFLRILVIYVSQFISEKSTLFCFCVSVISAHLKGFRSSCLALPNRRCLTKDFSVLPDEEEGVDSIYKPESH